MIKLRLVAAAAVAAAATLLSAGAAQAYPDVNVTLTIPNSTLVGGNTFTYTASADVTCSKWTITYSEARNGPTTQTGSGKSISGRFDTKPVKSTFKSPIKATCTYDNEDISAKVETTNEASPAFFSVTNDTPMLQAAIQDAAVTATITLLPKGGANDTNSTLPDTGGSNLWILVLGGALVVVGGGVTYAARRRHSAR